MKKFFKNNFHWFFPILAILLLSPFLNNFDLEVSKFFYSKDHFQHNPLRDFIYTYGMLPAQSFFILAVVMLIFSYIHPQLSVWRKGVWTVVLTMVIGIGLVINLGFKDHWGRPRPKQIQEFGGQQQFHPFYIPYIFSVKHITKIYLIFFTDKKCFTYSKYV